MALQFAIIAVVAGAVLGTRYNVLILVPAVMFAMLFAVIIGVARGDGWWSLTLMTVLLGAAVQVGYVAGAALHIVVEKAWAGLVGGRSNPELNTLGPQWSPSSAASRIRHSWPPHV
jgi:general stress protein CsbA